MAPPVAKRPRWRGLESQRTGRTVVVAAAFVVLIAVAALLGTQAGTETASAAEIRAKVAAGLRLDETVSGEFSVRTRDPGPRPPGVRVGSDALLQVPPRSRFVIAPDGSYANITVAGGAPSGYDVAYDANTGIETRLIPDIGGRPIYMRSKNIDPVFLAGYLPQAHLGSWVQGALTEQDPRVEEVRFDGRSAWRLTATFEPGESFYETYGARIDVVVDRDTGLVLELVQYAYDRNRWTSIASVREIRIGEPATPGAFTVPQPVGADELSHDFGFQRVPITSAAEIIGYRPPLPTNTLGRPLSDFAVAKTSMFPFPGIPIRRDIASGRYGRGATTITVSSYRGALVDLTTLVGGVNAHTIRLEGALLSESVAYLTTSPLSGAVVSAYADGLLVQVTAPSTNEALIVANSLQRVG